MYVCVQGSERENDQQTEHYKFASVFFVVVSFNRSCCLQNQLAVPCIRDAFSQYYNSFSVIALNHVKDAIVYHYHYAYDNLKSIQVMKASF